MALVDAPELPPPARASGPSRRDWTVILALWLLILASSSQMMIIAPILPRMGEVLEIPTALQGTLVTGFAVSMSIFAVTIGPVSDHVGRRAILLAGTGVMTLALLLHSLAFDYASILGARVGAGAAAGVLTGAAVAYIGDYFPYHRRGWASGWVMSGVAAGQILGVPAGTLLAARFGFDAPFSLFAAVMAGSFLMILVALPQPVEVRPEGRLTLAKGLRTYLALVRHPQIVLACAVQAAMFFSLWGFLTEFPTWAETTLGMSPRQIATLFMVGGVASIVIGPRAGRLSDRVGRKPLIVLSCFGSAGLLLGGTLVMRSPGWAYAWFFTALGLFSVRLPPFQALLTALVPARQRGSLMSLVIAIGQLGGGAGAALAGWIYAEGSFGACMLVAAGAMGVAALGATRLAEPQPGAAPGA